MKYRISILYAFISYFIIIQCVYITIPQHPDGCGGWTSDTYVWNSDDSKQGSWVPNPELIVLSLLSSFLLSEISDDIPSFFQKGSITGGGKNVRLYFCTGDVEESELPLGSYCFYQNPQNSTFF